MKNLKFLRESRSLNQRQFADAMKLSPRRISTYETGEVEPDIQTLMQFADFFGVSVDYLIGHDTDVLAKKDSSPFVLTKFGERIRQYRTEQKLTVKALAERIGITTQYLLVIETGGKIPALETCIKILNALELSADAAFMDSLIAGYITRSRYIELKIAALVPENQQLALELLETMVDSLSVRESNVDTVCSED